ncbi:hypothetical protein HMPREF1624_07851 [Sporothrix schenckii ATCC 58251]|uniref:Uncharacterized protein n=1 Tax=Sporothrix schenckii (strain ATCC 58251 / de Perez 2211183) TaxID=1391915 RepID=U7PLF8_SPOS1|nr:hypothetical protein HMPREF1624_07851 [Sporothrix schenckii ATCC 58251]
MMSYAYGNPYVNMPQTTSTMQPMQQPQPQQSQQYQLSTFHHQSNDTFLENLSRQLASVSSTLRRRHSRSSHYGSRTPGSAMRITKPSSANNSPQASVMMQARKRMAHDVSLYASPQWVPQQLVTAPDYLAINHRYDTSVEAAASRPARPVSWHPSSSYLMPNQLQTQQQVPLSLATNFQMPAQMSAYATPALPVADYEPFPAMQPFALSPSAYSSQTSPSTAFSPYSSNLDNTTAGHYYSPNPWALSPSVNANGALFDKLPSPVDCPALITADPHSQQDQQHEQREVPANQNQVYQDEQAQNVHNQPATETSTSTEWNSFATHGFAAPRTPPDNNCFSAAEPSQARIPSDGNIVTCQEQDDEQPEGEILVGMGLYDPPEKEVMDPTLQSYRSSVAQLLGSAYKFPEPTGKGLKLEDAWEPPENLDDDDEEDGNENDDDRDAEGEDQ